jgi:hypothetical protein
MAANQRTSRQMARPFSVRRLPSADLNPRFRLALRLRSFPSGVLAQCSGRHAFDNDAITSFHVFLSA